MYSLVDITHMLELSGVYVLYRKGIVVYVGKSTQLISRLTAHKRDKRFTYDRVLVHYCTGEEMDKVELIFINQYLPEFNRRDKVNFIHKIKIDLVKLGIAPAPSRPAWRRI